MEFISNGLVVVLLSLIGVCVGSFLNVLIDRLPKKQKLVKSRSICPLCKKTLRAIDLVPILSFLLLRGKCRYCKKKIDWTLPLVEVITGALFALVFLTTNGINAIYYILIGCVLIVVFFMDLKYRVIEDKIVLFGIISTLLYLSLSKFLSVNLLYTNLVNDKFGKYIIQSGYMSRVIRGEIRDFTFALLSGLLLFLFFYLLVIITKGRGMGGGDVKFAFLMGLITGFPKIIPAFFISFLTGAIAGIILMLVGKKTIKQTIPFGPFLVIGTAAGVVWGAFFVNWYLGLMR